VANDVPVLWHRGHQGYWGRVFPLPKLWRLSYSDCVLWLLHTEGEAMRCPFCGNVDTQVKDSRPAEDHVAIRRRRFCPACGGRFTTYERVQLRDLVVIKSSGRREPFDRDKLERSIRIAMQKRPIEPERIDQMISGIVRRLESLGDTDVPSKIIGEIVMETLARIDTVAYVRFASVYKNFQAADDFDRFVSELRPHSAAEE